MPAQMEGHRPVDVNMFLEIAGVEWYAMCIMDRFAPVVALCILGPILAVGAPMYFVGRKQRTEYLKWRRMRLGLNVSPTLEGATVTLKVRG